MVQEVCSSFSTCQCWGGTSPGVGYLSILLNDVGEHALLAADDGCNGIASTQAAIIIVAILVNNVNVNGLHILFTVNLPEWPV
jgi:hypothetical protein